ncbi:glutathione S-transferase A4-like [Gigantopelta aegis]|uniref:glutathione S-transferase A4-like n=1 Tax=Gigantopelta aegis TaxID=1735272 RepID=UPI001B888B99|nr:glutathione S-transferase A4-like [Gigantopelta aegis]
MSSAKLIYFNGRGRGEIVRLTLAATGIQFTEEFLTEPEQFNKLKSDGRLLFGQVPLLEIDGRDIVQTNAIVRYLATKGNIWGNEHEKVQVDMLYEGSRDFALAFLIIGFQDESKALDAAKSTTMPKYFAIFEEVLNKNGSGYLVGKQLTLADVGLLEPVLIALDYFGEEALKEFPSLKKFHSTMLFNERISSYLKGPQRKPKNDAAYVETVKTVLQRPITS